MDLRGILNTADNGGERRLAVTPARPHPQPPNPAHYNQQQASSPSTPIQGKPAFPYDYAQHTPHGSPGQPPQEYPAQRHASVSYPPPQSPYQQQPPQPSPYPQGRPVTSSIPPSNMGDIRSPSTTPGPGVIPGHSGSGYRHILTGPQGSGVATGYFTGQPEVASPVQQAQYPTPGTYPPRDAYPQQPGGPGPHGPFMQPPSMPQTPSIVTTGGPPYAHQRSQSSHSASTSTPTSAQTAHLPHGSAQFPLGSPITASRQPPFPRHQSQPPTSLGPPEARQASVPAPYPVPGSPYQKRMIASAQPFPQQAQPSPPQPQQPSVPRLPSSNSTHELQPDTSHRPHPDDERGRTVSVSPKTRVPTLQGGMDSRAGAQPVAATRKSYSTSGSETEVRRQLTVPPAVPPETIATTPAKRKLDQRDPDDEDTTRNSRDVRHRGAGVNGNESSRNQNQVLDPMASGPPRKRRFRHREPPLWALNTAGRKLRNSNYQLVKKGIASVNGKTESRSISRHTSPEASRASMQQQPTQPQGPLIAAESQNDNLLGPWEASILGIPPYEELSKHVADFLFIHVVKNPDAAEIASRGISFEIEAKLGTLIDKETNCRVYRSIATECILQESHRVAFRSSMTEAQHKGLNEFLNSVVVQTDPRNPSNASSARPRVQVHYKHRREVDRYFELPAAAVVDRMPECVRSLIPSKHSVKVRVTYDQRTGELLAKIVKARVADLSFHMPNCAVDCRLSINLEMDWEGSVEEIESLGSGPGGRNEVNYERNKDRLSYAQGHYQIDLTQVTVPSTGPTNKSEKEHELEIELAPGILIEQGLKALNGEQHRYQELVEALVNNVRVLARKTGEFLG